MYTEGYYILHIDPGFDHLLRLGFEFGDVRKCHVPRPAPRIVATNPN